MAKGEEMKKWTKEQRLIGYVMSTATWLVGFYIIDDWKINVGIFLMVWANNFETALKADADGK